MSRPALASGALGLARVAIVLAALLRIAARCTGDVTWDDAHMFGRYAENLLHHGTLAWNPGGPPTYGLTSLLFLLLVAPLRAALPGLPGLATALGSLLPALAFALVGVPVLVRRGSPARGPFAAVVALGLALLLVRPESPFFEHAGSGMDTTFDLLFVAGYLVVARATFDAPTRGRAVLLGLLGAASFGVRPDLLLFAGLVPFALATADDARRRAGLVSLGVTGLGLAAVLALTTRTFGSTLPLPFHAKATGLYRSPALVARYRGAGLRELTGFLEAFAPACVVVALDVASGARTWLLARRRLELSLLVASVVYAGFYAAFVMPIMGHFQRFYLPLVPPLFVLAASSAVELRRRLGARGAPARPTSLALAAGVLLTGLALPSVALGAREVADAHRRGALGDFDLGWAYRQRHAAYWYCLDHVAALPDDLVIASTEVGLPGALAPGKTVVDLAGLNDRDFALAPFSAARLFEKVRPDLIYLPHPDYDAMIRELDASPTLAEHYDVVPAERLRTTFGVALDRDGRHYTELRALVDGGCATPPPRAPR